MSPKKPESAAQAENEGLAARLIQLRETVEQNRQEAVRQLADMKGDVARISDRLEQAIKRVDEVATEWQTGKRDVENAIREGGEQVRAAGQIATRMSERVKVLDELRDTATDPHELVKPIRRDIANLRSDLESLGTNIEVKIAALRPKQTHAPLVTR